MERLSEGSNFPSLGWSGVWGERIFVRSIPSHAGGDPVKEIFLSPDVASGLTYRIYTPAKEELLVGSTKDHCVTVRAGVQPVKVPMGAEVSTAMRVSSPPCC